MTERPVRVLHVVVAGEIGGAERMLADLVRSDGRGPRVHGVALLSPHRSLGALFAESGAQVISRAGVKEGPIPDLVRALGRRDVMWLVEAARGFGAELFHLHTFGSQLLGTRAALRLGLPIVRTEHSTRVYDDPSCWPFSRWSLLRSDAVVAVSDHVLEVGTRRAPTTQGRWRRIYNGVDTERWSFVPGPSAGPPTFVALARLDPRKGLDRAIRAIASVPETYLEVVGDGSDRAELESLTRSLRVGHRIRFRGWSSDPRPHLARADGALCTSRREGLGLALLEAMAVGRPVVSLAVGGVSEIVRHERTGLLTDGTDPVLALAQAIARIARDRNWAHELGRNARARVVAEFSLEAMRRAYGEVYRDVLTPDRAHPRGAHGSMT